VAYRGVGPEQNLRDRSEVCRLDRRLAVLLTAVTRAESRPPLRAVAPPLPREL